MNLFGLLSRFGLRTASETRWRALRALQLLKAVLKALQDARFGRPDDGKHGFFVLCVGDVHVRILEVTDNFRDRLLGHLLDEPLDIMLVVSGVDVFYRVATVFLR